MMKRMISIVVAAMMLVSLFAVSASAANGATVTVASVNGKKGDIVEVPVTISENSYLVNADMHITFDSSKVKLVAYYADPDGDDGDLICYSTENTILGNGWMYLGNEITKGDFVFVAATGSQVGLTKGGELFRL
ncbi:MAG: hypothetical protein IKV35_00775, partial [Clostridia bacterium]|nr:hypothetical protein [Clostridia bacterium]